MRKKKKVIDTRQVFFKPLLDEDRKFVELYLTNGRVAWRAYRDSHPHLTRTDNKWRQLCTNYMKRVKIKEALEEADKKAMVRVEKAMSKYAITRERIAEELARIAFASVTDVVTFGPDGVVIKPSSELNDDEKASTAEVKETRNEKTGTTISVKHYDKVQALTALGKHMGMFVEQVDVAHRIAAKLIIEVNLVEIKYSYKHAPTIKKFSESNAFMRALMGPFGSGKSVGCVVEVLKRAAAQAPGPDGIRRSRWVAIRQTYPQLRDTTIKTFMQWVPPQHFGEYKQSENMYTISAFENCHIEVLFRALDKPSDVGNLLSMELTGGWVNEAKDVAWPVVEALQGRVGRYPSKREGGPTWHGVIMDTNPPDVDSRFYKYWENPELNPELAQIFKQPSGLSKNAENRENLPSRYYETLAEGKDPEWVKVFIEGQYGFVIDGRPVYPEYADHVHCKEIKALSYEPIVRGWDFGLCYDDQTEVLTEKGWKFFKDVDEKTDRAATRNPVTKELEYTNIGFKIEKDYKGKMLEWANREINFCVTPEHRIPYTTRNNPDDVLLAAAEDLAKQMSAHRYVDLCSTWKPEYNINQSYFDMTPLAFARVSALVLSEGSVCKNRISIYQRKHLKAFRKILEDSGLEWTERVNYKNTVWTLTNKPLADYFRKFGTSKFKEFPMK